MRDRLNCASAIKLEKKTGGAVQEELLLRKYILYICLLCQFMYIYILFAPRECDVTDGM